MIQSHEGHHWQNFGHTQTGWSSLYKEWRHCFGVQHLHPWTFHLLFCQDYLELFLDRFLHPKMYVRVQHTPLRMLISLWIPDEMRDEIQNELEGLRPSKSSLAELGHPAFLWTMNKLLRDTALVSKNATPFTLPRLYEVHTRGQSNRFLQPEHHGVVHYNSIPRCSNCRQIAKPNIYR